MRRTKGEGAEVARIPGRRTAWLAIGTMLAAAAAAAFLGVSPSAKHSPVAVRGTGGHSTQSLADAPGRRFADVSDWSGPGDLAFVSEGRLEILDNDGSLRTVAGPTAGGVDASPAWSFDGQWLAFLHTMSIGAAEVSNPTLWIVRRGQSVATRLGSDTVNTFAWSPTADSLGFLAYGSPSTLDIERLGSGGGLETLTLPNGSGGFAWSPDGSEIAFDGRIPAAMAPTGQMSVVPAGGGPVTVEYQSDGNGLDLAGWRPDGRGLLFWVDDQFSASAQAGGLPLDSLALGASVPIELTQSLVGTEWLAAGPDNTVAVVVGGGREIWAPGRNVDVCSLDRNQCDGLLIGRGVVGLSPGWTDTGGLDFTEAPAKSQLNLDFFGPRVMQTWDHQNQLWSVQGGIASLVPVSAAPSGSVFVEPSTQGPDSVVVADDALWLVDPSSANLAVKVADPLFSSAGPPGYYGEVDWGGTFAWSAAAGPRSGSIPGAKLYGGHDWPLP